MSKIPADKLTEHLTKTLMDNGKIIEAGWAALCAVAMPPLAPPEQVADMRNAFYCGALHLWSSIMVGLDSESEETPGDLSKMTKIQAELDKFEQEFMNSPAMQRHKARRGN